MFRIKLIVAVLGGIIVYWGVQEFRVSQGTSSDPVSAELAALESGTELPNAHVQLGEHIALYPASIYEYRQSKYDRGEPGPGTKVTHCYYPAFSASHPAFASEDAAASFDNFAVLVKTKRFATIGDIPDVPAREQSIHGLVINRIESLDKEERKLLTESFPGINLDRVLILEDGRKPASIAKSGGMMGGGLLLAVVGVVWMFAGGSAASSEE